MFEHVTVQKPFAWIVCCEGDVTCLGPIEQHSVTPRPKCSVILYDTKMVPMQMHGMWPTGVVDDLNPNAFAKGQRRQQIR